MYTHTHESTHVHTHAYTDMYTHVHTDICTHTAHDDLQELLQVRAREIVQWLQAFVVLVEVLTGSLHPMLRAHMAYL